MKKTENQSLKYTKFSRKSLLNNDNWLSIRRCDIFKKALPGSLACLVSISFSLENGGTRGDCGRETRSPKPEAEVSPWVTALKESEWTFRQVEGVWFAALGPGAFLGSSGQAGSQVSLFSRGGNSDHTAFFMRGEN